MFGYWLRQDDPRSGRLAKAPTDLLGGRDRSIGAVAPDGRHFLNFTATSLSTHAFPSMELIAEQSTDALFGGPESWRYVVGYYDASTLIATLTEGGVVKAAKVVRVPSLELLGEIEHPGGTSPSALVPTGDGTWLTVSGPDLALWTSES
jgi:hypothetical protein